MNKVQLLSRLTKNVDLKTTSTGKQLASFTLAVDMGKDSEGNKKTVFLPCSAWDKKAELLSQYVFKGQRLLITNGVLQVRSYTDSANNQRIFTYVEVREFEFIETKSSAAALEAEATAMPKTGEQLEAEGALTKAGEQPAQSGKGAAGATTSLGSMGMMFDEVDINF